MEELTNILIVDDLPENILALESLLDLPGLNLLKATSGNQALTLASQHDLALILLDVQMPSMDGFETAELLRSRPKTRGIPIIFVSAINREQRHVFKGYELGAVDYLFKPIDSYVLLSKVQVFITLHRQSVEIRRVNARLLQEIAEHRRSEQAKTALEAQLGQALKLEALGRLAGGIAHDFNNILAPIVGFTEMLLDEVDPAASFRPSLQSVLEAALRGRDLVQQILVFSRKNEPGRRVVQAQPIIQQVFRLFSSSLPPNIKWNLDLADDCGPILADPTQFHQVVLNLAANAWHAMEPLGGDLNVSLREVNVAVGQVLRLPPGRYLLLTVRDSGCGMQPEVLERIFEPYFTTKQQGKGTGLGLSVVHGIVAAAHGEIHVASEVGRGSQFDVYWPVCAAEVPELESLEGAKAAEFGQEKVLLVDDNPATLEVTRMMLDRLGYRVQVALDGSEALTILERDLKGFDILITDFTMPGLTGVELADRARVIRPDLPVILCSGYGDAVSEDVSRGAGIKAQLGKPIQLKEMARIVRQVLDGGLTVAG